MPVAHSSRELSQRVEVESHRHANRFRRLTWWTAMFASFAVLIWLGFAAVRGDHRLYQSGSLSTPHRMFENSCNTCHNTWGPAKRLVSLDDHTHSIDAEKCLQCHAGSLHFDSQKTSDHHCADCHREHDGEQNLVLVANRLCIECHSDLRSIHTAAAFANKITQFDNDDQHPDFAFHRLRDAEFQEDHVHVRHKIHDVMKFFQREGETKVRWQDKAKIRFNHAKHLIAEYDTNGKLVKGLLNKDR